MSCALVNSGSNPSQAWAIDQMDKNSCLLLTNMGFSPFEIHLKNNSNTGVSLDV